MNTLTKLTIVAVAIGAISGYAIGATQTKSVSAEPIPGQPFTYTEKYQCPFYENVGEKGCQVPPNIECNADWSVCTMKEDAPVAPVDTAPVVTTPVPVTTPKPVSGCAE